MLEDGTPDSSRLESKESALMRVRLLVGGQVVLLGALLQAAAAVQVIPESSRGQSGGSRSFACLLAPLQAVRLPPC